VESQRTLLYESRGVETSTEESPRRSLLRGRAPHEPTEQTRPEAAGSATAKGLVLGRYRLHERLGSGGFGVVWSAHDELLGRDVALKRIALGPDGDRERATREAHASARLAHPAIVALYEACVVEDAFFLISELVEGETLARLIAEEELQDEEVLEIGLALAAALSHAHARGVIHRDIKPQNVLVPHQRGKGGEAAKLTDFGGASLVGEDALTRTGDVLGTLAYMAPEQSEGAPVGEEADLYALVLVLYEAFSGVNPVRGATPAATARRIGHPLESLARHRRDLPRELIAAIDDALAPAPDERGTLEDLRLALEEALEEGPSPRRRRARPPRRELPTRRAPELPRRSTPRRPAIRERPLDDPRDHQATPLELEAPEEHPQRLSLPRAVWLAGALLLIGWQVWVGHSGVALLALAALLPWLAIPAEARTSSRVAAGWLVCALAPILGVVGLASSFPALAGQAARWRERLLFGALAYWWLELSEPLLGRRLWLGPATKTPPYAVWESSITSAATHVIVPLFTLATLLGALLWACAAVLLPWIVRGRSALLDVLGAIVWSTALVAATPLLDGGLAAHSAHPSPRGLLLGALLGAMVAVAARALRGPV
jgi:eukaryotic-like serine/threonine-protein kinase